jgi:hypothetical protein
MQVDASLDSLLKSLDLEKYLINFQAEEACLIYHIWQFHIVGVTSDPKYFVNGYSSFRLI